MMVTRAWASPRDQTRAGGSGRPRFSSRARQPLAQAGPAHQLRQAPARLSPEDQVQVRRRGQQAFPLLLGHATSHPQDEPGVPGFQKFQTSQQAFKLFLGFAPDGAGIDKI